MGSWNSKPFGNDTALDWLADLERAEDPKGHIESTIAKISESWDGESPEAEEAVAAIAVVAAAAVDPIGSINQDAKRWIAESAYVPTNEQLLASKRALARISESSELRDLWEESELLNSWLRQNAKVAANIDKAIECGLPTRRPRKRGMPRSLHKLLERYAEEPSDKIRKKIREKVEALEDPNAASSATDYMPPLSLLAQYGLEDEVRVLLEKGAQPTVQSPDAFSAACNRGHVQVAEVLRKAGAQIFFEVQRDPNNVVANALGGVVLDQMKVFGIKPKADGYRYCLALFSVARLGSPETAAYLVSLGADLKQEDLNGETLIHKASEGGNIEMLKFLMDEGVDIDKPKGQFGESPLHYAVRANQRGSVEFLLKNGANPNHIEKFEGREHRWYETPLDLCTDSEIRKLLRGHGARTANDIMESGGAGGTAT